MRSSTAWAFGAVVCMLAHAARAHEADDIQPDLRLPEVLIEAPPPLSAASADDIRARDFEMRPHQTLQDILNNVPGVIVRQHQGGGKATQYLVRGFNADHGTDFAVSVDGLPVNLVTHAHGQGYADLNFVIPETIERLQLRKGPYAPDQGDLATAGSLNLVTRDRFEENFALAEGGSFDRQRYVVGLSPEIGNLQTLFAGQAYYSNGPFENPEHFARYNAYGKVTLADGERSKLSLSGGFYAGDWDASGQIPQREVSAGRLDRFGAIDPTEGGRTDRQNLDLHWNLRPTLNDRVAVQLWASRYKLRLWSNFTFFQDFYATPDGDVFRTPDDPIAPGGHYLPASGIEQNDSRVLYGGRATWAHGWTLAGLPLESSLGVETRNDQIDVAVYRELQRNRFFTLSRSSVVEQSFSAFWGQQIFFTDWLRFEGGLRGDVFVFDVDDDLPPQDPLPPSARPRTSGDGPYPIQGRRSDGIVSPKANLILTPHHSTEIYLNFGTGFHSNDARGVIQANGSGNDLPLVRALGYELGSRTRQLDGRLDAAAALWVIDLDSEIVFCGDCGTVEEATGGSFEPTGATRRWGVDLELRYQINRWLAADYDLSWADPRYDTGAAIPIAPTLFMNGGLTADLGNGFQAAWRIRYLDDRPATDDRSVIARGYLVMDLLAKYRWRNLEASVALLNLGNFDWQEAVFADTSLTRCELTGRCPRTTRPDIHFTPGDPFGVRAGLKVYF